MPGAGEAAAVYESPPRRRERHGGPTTRHPSCPDEPPRAIPARGTRRARDCERAAHRERAVAP
jgi:hypothetical protein